MKSETVPGAAPPDPKESHRPQILAFDVRETAFTEDGPKPATRLRPGDGVRTGGAGPAEQVAWVSIGAQVLVFLGDADRREVGLPRAGGVSPATGRLVLDLPGGPGTAILP